MDQIPSFIGVGNFLSPYFEEIQKNFESEIKRGIAKSLKELNGTNFIKDLFLRNELKEFLKLPETKKRKVLKLWLEDKSKEVFNFYCVNLPKTVDRAFPSFSIQYGIIMGNRDHDAYYSAVAVKKSKLKSKKYNTI
jgi:hypothetical protein